MQMASGPSGKAPGPRISARSPEKPKLSPNWSRKPATSVVRQLNRTAAPSRSLTRPRRIVLPLDAVIEGPAIIEQMDTTSVIEPGDIATGDKGGNLLVDLK
mgnify:CR=1 FL=1